LFRASSKFASTQVSAIATGYASYPFNTVRHCLQLQSDKPKEEWDYAVTMDCFRKIIENQGTAALFKGAGANTLHTVGA
jgi:solute carrier family 25 (adenine nucleotide translocator) protein 4/5/6/31